MTKITISKRAAVVIAFAVVLAIPGVAGATHIFTDVTDGNVHAEGIEWVANAQVTSGCGDGTTYCPNDPVTRAQMGTFMYRLAGHAPGVPPSVDADTVDGYQANELARASFATGTADIDGFDSAAFTSILNGSATAPVDGLLMIWVNVNAEWDVDSPAGSTADLDVQIAVDGMSVGILMDQEFADVTAGSNSGESIALTAVVPVTAGDHSVDINAQVTGASMIYIKNTSIATLFVPFGNDGMANVLGSLAAQSVGSSTND